MPSQADMIAACLALANSDPALAVALAEELSVDSQAAWVMKSLIQTWTEVDARAARVWLQRLPAGERRDVLMARHAWVLASTRPAEAYALVLDEVGLESVRDTAQVEIMSTWARQDLPAAFDEARRISRQPLQARVLTELQRSSGLAGY